MSWSDLVLRLLQDRKLYRRVVLLLVPLVLVVVPTALIVLALL